MSLSSALTTALTGLQANQAALSVVSSNVANAKTPGYVAKTAVQVQIQTGDLGAGVRTTGVNRQLDEYVLSQLRTETSGSAYASQIADILTRLQSIYGTPGGTGTLESAFSNFTTALQSLATTSGSQASQAAALSAAQALAQQLNVSSQGIQTLRTNVEQDIGASVNRVNVLLTQVAQLNSQLQGLNASDSSAAGLLDQRDGALNELSQYLDIRILQDGNNQVSVFTPTGIQLIGAQASQLSFTGQGQLNPTSLWNADPSKSTVGALTVRFPSGASMDLVSGNTLASGRLGADLQLRDKLLVQAQTQLDQIAATLSSALSDKTTSGSAVTSGTQAGFDLDLSGLQAGNSISLTYTTTATGEQRKITIVRVDDPAALPLSNTATSTADDTVIGVNFSGGMASVVAQLNAALGAQNLQFANPAGSTLRVLDNGSGAAAVNAASTTVTRTVLADGNPQLPVFTDGTQAYSGAIASGGLQLTGFAARISVNQALIADPTRFTIYNTAPQTASGDTTRTDYLFTQLTSASFVYSPTTGLGSVSTPFRGTLTSFIQQSLSQQSDAASNAQQLQQGQEVVVNTLQQKFDSVAGVNIDTEMSNLIALQNTYAANAHVMSAVQSMMTTLMQLQF